MVGALDLKFEVPSLDPSDHQLDLFQVVPGSIPRLRLVWSASWDS